MKRSYESASTKKRRRRHWSSSQISLRFLRFSRRHRRRAKAEKSPQIRFVTMLSAAMRHLLQVAQPAIAMLLQQEQQARDLQSEDLDLVLSNAIPPLTECDSDRETLLLQDGILSS